MLHPEGFSASVAPMTLRTAPILAAILMVFPMLSMAKTTAADARNLTILADDALMLPLAELSRSYATESGTPLTVIRASGDPAQQIEQGYEAHILLSADPTLIERLAQRGLIDVFGTKAFASTQLALVAPTRMQASLEVVKRISFAAILYKMNELPVYTNDPSTPGGLRAQALVEGRSFSHDLAQRMQVMPNLDAVLETLRKKDGFALMLASNAITEPDMMIVSLLPESTSEPVRYDAVVLASESMENARDFTKFLQSSTAQEILSTYGFQKPSTAKP